MNLSKMKFALVGVMIMGVFSLNFMNPFTMSNNEFDVKGVAHEMSISTTSPQANAAAIPPTLVPAVAVWALIQTSIAITVTLTRSCSEQANQPDLGQFDGIAQVSIDNLTLAKLD